MFYPNDLHELKTVQKYCYLPVGNPSGTGCLAFLFSKSVDQSINMITKRSNFYHNNRYKYYYYPLLYSGKINNHKYYIRNPKLRKDINEKVGTTTALIGIETPKLMPTFVRNLYVDLSCYQNIFEKMTSTLVPIRKMLLFWKYYEQILNSPEYKNYPTKCVLIPIDENIKFTGKLKELINNPIYLFYYTLYRDYTLCKNVNMDFLFYSEKYCLKWNPSKSDKKTFNVFKQQMKLLLSHAKINVDEIFDEENIDKEDQIENIKSGLAQVYNFTGDADNTEVITSLDQEVETEVEKKSEKKLDEVVKKASTTTKDPEQVKKQVEEELNNDKQFIEDMFRATAKTSAKSPICSARDAKIKADQVNVKVGNMTIGDLQKINANNIKVPVRDVSRSLHTTNPNVKKVRFANFEKTYNENLMKKDIAGVFTSLNDKSLPLYVINTEIVDSSDELNYKETWRVTLEDTLRKRHIITVDIPKFVDDKFMYIGGNKKLILKQNFFFPVVKVNENTVEIITNENKMTIRRVDNKDSSSTSRLNRMINANEDVLKFFTTGNAYVLNNEYITTVEYDELSKKFMSFKTPKCELFFSLRKAGEYAEKHGLKLSNQDTKMFIGQENGKEVIIDVDTQRTEAGDSIMDIIIRNLPEDMQASYKSIRTPKRLMFAQVKTMDKFVPVGLLIGYWEGLETVLRKCDVEYRVESSYPKELTVNEGVIRFSDCYLVYKADIGKELILNGYRIIDTTKYKLIDFNTQDPYLEYFAKTYGKMSIANPLMNTYEFTIDHITKEILETTNLPTNIVDLMIYAVKLLGDNRYLPVINQTLNRVRSNEIVAAILYDAIAKQYTKYKNSNGKNKLSIPRDIVIKELLGLKTVEDASILNPVLELERTHTIMQKGWRGINLDDSYTPAKRAYDKTMIGVIGPTTSPDGSVGVQRTLTMEPNIDNLRGFTSQPENLEDLKDVNLFSPGEMLIPLGATRDDSTRMG